ncbi:hypothetical protein IJT93_03975 [bacterium]|nr:hypothetical protein [bacterium]
MSDTFLPAEGDGSLNSDEQAGSDFMTETQIDDTVTDREAAEKLMSFLNAIMNENKNPQSEDAINDEDGELLFGSVTEPRTVDTAIYSEDEYEIPPGFIKSITEQIRKRQNEETIISPADGGCDFDCFAADRQSEDFFADADDFFLRKVRGKAAKLGYAFRQCR